MYTLLCVNISVVALYVELLSMTEKSLIELHLACLGEAPFSKCHRSPGGGKSNSISEYTIVGIKYNFKRNRKALAIN